MNCFDCHYYLYLNGHRLTVEGNASVGKTSNNAYIYIQKGEFICDGNVTLNNVGYLTCLCMQNDEDYVSIGGNLLCQNSSSMSSGFMKAGTLEIKGDFTQEKTGRANNFVCSGTHKVILSGEKA